MVKELQELRTKKVEQEEQVSETNRLIEEKNQAILNHLDSAGIDSARTEFGLVSRREIISVTTPKDLVDKSNFRVWLTEQIGPEGVEAMLSINSRTLQSLVTQELEKRKAAGDLDQTIPGITNIARHYTISLRK